MNPRVGIDFGGVIVKPRKQSSEETALQDSDRAEVAQEGAFEAIAELVSLCSGSVWIVSTAGPRMQARTREWLNSVDFFRRTGLHPDHVRFCLERPEKESICRELKITHFIDDRIHIMQILRHSVSHLYFFGEKASEKNCPPWARFVSDWADLVELIQMPSHEGGRSND